MLKFLLLSLLAATLAHAAPITGKVVGIADGDTLTVLTAEKQQVKIRLEGIDAPEAGQEYGQQSKQALSALSRAPAALAPVESDPAYVAPAASATTSSTSGATYWINTNGVRHNAHCHWYGNTKAGQY